MAKKVYDAAVKVREYTDRDGNTRGEWLNVGSVIEYDDGNMGLMLNRTFNPAGLTDNGKGSVAISFFEPKQREQKQAPAPEKRPAQQKQESGFDDDIPF